MSWEHLHSLFESAESLSAACQGDFDVRLAVYPDSLGFLLRVYVPEDGEIDDLPCGWGTFDLTCAHSSARQLATLLEDTCGLSCFIDPAKSYFDLRYAG